MFTHDPDRQSRRARLPASSRRASPRCEEVAFYSAPMPGPPCPRWPTRRAYRAARPRATATLSSIRSSTHVSEPSRRRFIRGWLPGRERGVFAEACGKAGVSSSIGPPPLAIRAMVCARAKPEIMRSQGACGAGLFTATTRRQACWRSGRRATSVSRSDQGLCRLRRPIGHARRRGEPRSFQRCRREGAKARGQVVRSTDDHVLIREVPGRGRAHRDSGLRATGYGDCVYLFEGATCSIHQRATQSIEEAAPQLIRHGRKAMGEGGRGCCGKGDRLLRRGTVELTSPHDGHLLLMEMNTPACRSRIRDRGDHRPGSSSTANSRCGRRAPAAKQDELRIDGQRRPRVRL